VKKIFLKTIVLPLIFLPGLGVASEAENHRIDPGKIVSFIIGDWNNDGGLDRAILVAPENEDHDVGLYIFFQGDANDSALEIFKPNLVWSGSLGGTMPSLSITPSGSLQVSSQNQAIGRSRWAQKLTIAYRNKHFVVAGYTYDSYDTLDLSAGFSCDVNLLTGRGIKDKKAFKTSSRAVKLADWSYNAAPKQCQAQ